MVCLQKNQYNAFITVADVRRKEKGRLSSLTFGVKDNIDVRGLPTTAASRILHGNMPKKNALVVDRILDGGGRIVGKTNMHEFAIGATTTSSAAGPCLNPRNPAHITGGSSGGSAACVASGEANVGIGTDTGGSVRLPAALCGVIGFKPTTGIISDEGVVPLSKTLDAVGILGGRIDDVELVFETILGRRRVAVEWAGSERKPKIGLYMFGTDAVSLRVREFVDGMKDRFDLSPVDIPLLTKEGPRLRRTVSSYEGAGFHRKWMEERSGEYFPDVLSVLRGGSKTTDEQYSQARVELQALREDFEEKMKGYDALLSPTVTQTAPLIATVLGHEADYRSLLALTELFNATGSPSISLPVGEVDGLPVGLMVSGAFNCDFKTLSVAKILTG